MSTQTTQRFEGRTIEEALSAAVSSFGDELDIMDAQRVRRGGVLGFFAKERFEVVAATRGDEEARFEAVLAAMVDRVDDAHEYRTPDRRRSMSATWQDADFVLPAPDRAAPGEPTGAVWIDAIESTSPSELLAAALPDFFDTEPEPAVHTAANRVEDNPLERLIGELSTTAITTEAATAVDTMPSGEAAAAVTAVHGPARSSIEEGEPVWDRTRLRDLGIPAQILGGLPPENPATDLGWVAALASAIEHAMPEELAAVTRVEITGHGVDAVIDLLRGATAGFRPARLVMDGHSVAATPLELALAVRACLRREAA
ncbi:MAG: hypothetical protein KDB21_14835 [Acidimicrobiales bacterium]|nr:hypothetical protein [Acidimicrobiales bacterium]